MKTFLTLIFLILFLISCDGCLPGGDYDMVTNNPMSPVSQSNNK